MADDVTIKIGADQGEALKGVDQVEKALKGLSDAEPDEPPLIRRVADATMRRV